MTRENITASPSSILYVWRARGARSVAMRACGARYFYGRARESRATRCPASAPARVCRLPVGCRLPLTCIVYTHELRHAAPGRPHPHARPAKRGSPHSFPLFPLGRPAALFFSHLSHLSLARGFAFGGAASPERSAYGARARASPCLVHALRASRVLDAWRAVDIIPPSSAAARRRLETRDPSRLACLHAHRAAFFPACLFLPCAAAAPCCLRSPAQAAARSA